MLSEFVSALVKKSVAIRALRRMMESTTVQDLREETIRQPKKAMLISPPETYTP